MDPQREKGSEGGNETPDAVTQMQMQSRLANMGESGVTRKEPRCMEKTGWRPRRDHRQRRNISFIIIRFGICYIDKLGRLKLRNSHHVKTTSKQTLTSCKLLRLHVQVLQCIRLYR
ncbi:hypothetical protein DPMN_067072 [Dreissena polymorpha]|uniref:Uncharacterized protein n=1 Tax=Dreissena polymorpha TaxID=45954 RepID=A0A9D3YYZ6_DREPO|nr:hypothetical protein DPMN_067072 [Dreissena polymorpha]